MHYGGNFWVSIDFQSTLQELTVKYVLFQGIVELNKYFEESLQFLAPFCSFLFNILLVLCYLNMTHQMLRKKRMLIGGETVRRERERTKEEEGFQR